MEQPFIAKKQTYLSDDKKTTFTVYHPAIKFPENEDYVSYPDKDSRTGLMECENEDEALRKAEELYLHIKKRYDLIKK